MNDLGRRKTLFLFWSGCFHYVTHCSVVPLVTLINTLHNGSLFLYRVTHKTTIQLSPCFSGAVLWLCFWCPPPVNVLVFTVTLYNVSAVTLWPCVSAATLSQICWPQPLSCSPYWMWPRNYPQRKITSLYQQNIADYLIQRHISHAMHELRSSISWGCQKYC